MNTQEDRIDLFDSWASSYDRNLVADPGVYPFAGYDEVVAAVVATARVDLEHRVLDIGAGTGNLTAKLVDLAGEVWGTDYSERMLLKARDKVPQACFVRWDVRESWPSQLPSQFDRIVSTYVFHEFDDVTKLRLLIELAKNRLRPGGYMVIGDIAFPNAGAQAACREDVASAWDESEHYWVANRIIPQLEKAGFIVGHRQISFCGGIFVLQLKDAT